MIFKKLLIVTTLLIALFSGYQVIKIETKAVVAQHLIKTAWQKSLTTNNIIKPWSWADTWPIMKLNLAGGETQYVLYGMSGQALAFGPAHMTESALPGQGKDIVIAAHRDTHFSNLKDLVLGDTISLEDRHKNLYDYRIVSARVVDTRNELLYLDDSQENLRLITCYPFDALNPNGPLRYEIVAIPQHLQIDIDFENPGLMTAL
jgi:sortase A